MVILNLTNQTVDYLTDVIGQLQIIDIFVLASDLLAIVLY